MSRALPPLLVRGHRAGWPRLVALCLVCLALAGCVEIVALGVSAVVGGASVYQRYEDRQTQRDQTEEIRALREELARTRKVLEERGR